MNVSISDVSAVPAAAPINARGDSPRALPLSTPVQQKEVAVPASPEASAQQLERAVEQLNRHFAEARTDLKFSVEKDLGVVVVAVVDSRDGTVLRQIPSEEALHIARTLDRQTSGLIEATA